jgi:hypothetical protein
MMADEYERAFMGGDGALFSERVRNRYIFLGLGGGTVGALVAGVALSVSSGSIIPALVSAGFGARAVLVGTNDAQGLMSAIERARGAPPVQVRVAEPDAEAAIEDPSEASGEAQGAMRTNG